ncbi:MAG: class I SAM-dependent methyltransferase [Myxococcota bacterium]|nr:class I SAM-dependent methyltransferase [Myxococcota bacterium]
MVDPKERFTGRVDDYERYRPGYPPELLELATGACGVGPGRIVADIGSGTGILTRLLLTAGASVIGIEPNAAMRAAAERTLSGEPRFESLDGCAEATGMGDASVDVIVAGQAFHWFDPTRTRAEFARILRPGGWVILAWNRRKDTAFGRDYEQMLERLAPDYAHVRTRDRTAEAGLRAFFAPGKPTKVVFDNDQRLDQVGLRGRLLSSSFVPRAADPLFAPIMQRLAEIFRTHAQGGRVTLAYDTLVWYGRLDESLVDPASADA